MKGNKVMKKKKKKDWIDECASSIGRLKMPSYTIAFKDDRLFSKSRRKKSKEQLKNEIYD